MKINDRTLIKHATSSHVPVDTEGFLYKRGEVNRSFQKRWCVLKGNIFYYFNQRADREPIGCVILEGCCIEVAEFETGLYAFMIAFAGPNARQYILAAETQEDMERWMKALACASYDYLKSVVDELQSQLNNINESEKRELMRTAYSSFSTSSSHSQQRSNPFDLDSDLINLQLNATPESGHRMFSQIPFNEIHTRVYGSKFIDYFESRRAARLAHETSSVAHEMSSVAHETSSVARETSSVPKGMSATPNEDLIDFS